MGQFSPGRCFKASFHHNFQGGSAPLRPKAWSQVRSSRKENPEVGCGTTAGGVDLCGGAEKRRRPLNFYSKI